MLNNKDQLDALKKSIPLWLAAEPRLKGMSRRGEEWDFQCFWHPDDSPSFQVYREEDGTWLGHCKACGATKNIFQLVQEVDNISFAAAVEKVRQMENNPDWTAKRNAADAVFQRTLGQSKSLVSAPLEAFLSYTEALKNSPEARAWLKNRGISQETAETFSLGYVQTPLPQVVPSNHPWASKGWILFPEIRHGRVVAVKYRSLMGKKVPKTDNTQGWSGFAQRRDMLKSPLYNQEAINGLDAVLVTEGEPDALIVAQAAISGVSSVSLPSAGYNPSPEMRGLLKTACAIYLAGDMDEAGMASMTKLHKELGGDDPRSRTYMIQWPAGNKDANDVFLKECHGDIPKFRDLVLKLMAEARDRRLPGVRDMKTVTQNVTFKPTHENPARLAFPWGSIDKWCDILPGEVMFLFGTETKTGKSTFLMNVLVHNVLKGKKVINFSAELSPERYAQIVVAHLLRKNRNTLNSDDFKAAADLIPEDSFYIGYKPGLNFDAVLKLLESAIQVYGGDIVVVDPLHFLIRGERDENAAFAAAMRKLVDFSIKWNKIVVAVGQARKGAAGMKSKMANGQDARFSAALSEDAATTWIIHRNRVSQKSTSDGEDEEPVFEATTRVKLDYSRNSDPKSGKLVFDGACASFIPWTGFEPQTQTNIQTEEMI